MTFLAAEANPRAESRDATFSVKVNNENQSVTITQDGSTLEKGDNISLGAAGNGTGNSSFTTTKGLTWDAVVSGEDWWSWAEDNPGTSGSEATGESQILKVKTTAANPSAQARSGKITVKAGASVGDAGYTGLKQEIAVTQAGSTVTGSATTIAAEGVNSQSSSFTATPGLDWTASVTSGDWITLTGAESGSPTSGSSQDITFKAPVNPSSSSRTGEITVSAGDADTGPTGKITVTQNASSLIVGDLVALAATKDATGSLKITGTSGLPLTITTPSWIEITTDPVPAETVGSEQTVAYKTKEVNLNSSERVAENTSVKAGNITQTVSIKQSGSIFTVSETELSLEKAGGSKTVEVEGTVGLPWTVSPSGETKGITPDITSSETGNTKQTLTFTATENTGGVREVTFTIAVTGGNHSQTVTVTQKAGLTDNTVTIDQAMVDAYKNAQSRPQFPPFNYDYGNVTDSGRDYKGVSSPASIASAYIIEVEKTQSAFQYAYSNSAAKNYCQSLGEGWRLPMAIELYAMWTKCKGTNNDAQDDESESWTFGAKFLSDWYWTASAFDGDPSTRILLKSNTGGMSYNQTISERPVRCVREL